ncbi:hypothetical protein GCM10020216_051080 [Nonomuraea helvata]
MAAPHVTGALALLRQKRPRAGVDQLVDLLRRSGKPITYTSAGAEVTTPRINVYAALHSR